MGRSARQGRRGCGEVPAEMSVANRLSADGGSLENVCTSGMQFMRNRSDWCYYLSVGKRMPVRLCQRRPNRSAMNRFLKGVLF